VCATFGCCGYECYWREHVVMRSRIATIGIATAPWRHRLVSRGISSGLRRCHDGGRADELSRCPEIDHIRDVPDRHPRRRFRQVVASQKFVSEKPIAISRHSAHATYVWNECTDANLESVSDTPTTCPVHFPLQPSCCRTARTDPYIRLASAYVGTQRTGPFRYRTPRAARRSIDTLLVRECAERTTRRNLVVTVTKLRHMPPRTVEHRAESDNGQVWRRENWT
jgi:hypothetical protein